MIEPASKGGLMTCVKQEPALAEATTRRRASIPRSRASLGVLAAAVGLSVIVSVFALLMGATDREPDQLFAATQQTCAPTVSSADCEDHGAGSLNSPQWQLVIVSRQSAGEGLTLTNRTYASTEDPRDRVGITVFQGAGEKVTLGTVSAHDPTAQLVKDLRPDGDVIRTGPGLPTQLSYQWTAGPGTNILVTNLSGRMTEESLRSTVAIVAGA